MALRALLLFLAAFTLTACAYGGSGNTNPVIRKLTWFSYINGNDIRAGCTAGEDVPRRYRFVYNGVYQEQIRTYDIVAAPDGSEGVMTARVVGPTRINRLFINSFSDIFAPGRGTIATKDLSAEQLARLDSAVEAGGARGPAPVGLDLWAENFYWVVVACLDGEVIFNVFKWPSERFEQAAFPQVLLALDPTGVPLNPPREVDLVRLYGGLSEQSFRRGGRFLLTVGENGFVGL